jgi:hypothetical protein
LRNFRRWAPFRAGPIESVGLGANPFDGHSCNHKLCDSAFLDALSGCRTAAKLFRGKSRIFLALQTRAKTMAASTRDSVPSGEQSDNGKPCPTRLPPVKKWDSFYGERESGSRAAAFFAGAHFVAIVFQVAVQAGAADSKDLRCAQAIPPAQFEQSLDM